MNLLSAMYRGGVDLRNYVYDRSLLESHRLAAPVISVGSISAGGAGKTPFVIMLGEMLRQRGLGFDVLSRGYGRKSRGARAIDSNGVAAEFGDEPLLIARRLECPVIVGESRFEAGKLAEQQFGSQLHILDDGFQHRSLARDFDIALLTQDDLKDRLLPSGRLREPLRSLRRADVIAFFDDAALDSLQLAGPAVWHVRRSLSLPEPPANPIAFCGIARPQNFLEQLKSAGVTPIMFKSYRDHHAYTEQDIRNLLALRDQNKAGGFITTEKDAVNLGSAIAQLGEVTIARVTMDIAEPADALDTMLRVIDERKVRA
jgi:tetraacyldisaccharide 4'-kinase